MKPLARAKPEDWDRVRRVGDGVTFIDEPFIKEFYRDVIGLRNGTSS